tara:strand:+ start:904 stop:1803 length:900 start_codon:yes stop_codon:yes gene_type:complete
MLGLLPTFLTYAEKLGLELIKTEVKQTLSEEEISEIITDFDGWIIGDDPATRRVLKIGSEGKLKAAVKWGIGVDNVDFEACKEYGISIANTPGMFGKEVSDVAIGYVIALARQTFYIDRAIRKGDWPKPVGISLNEKVAAVVGYGDIGRNTVDRLRALGMKILIYDPFIKEKKSSPNICFANWPERIDEADFIIMNCALSPSSLHMVNSKVLSRMKDGVRIVNVGRGQLIEESALIKSLNSGKVHSVALDVFEEEPIKLSSPLLKFENCIFGSHNSSNTIEGVTKTSKKAIQLISSFLK